MDGIKFPYHQNDFCIECCDIFTIQQCGCHGTESNKNGELWITGRARVYWGADPQAQPRPLGSKYNDVPIKVDGNYCSINSTVLFWDSAAQWFGIRLENF